MASTTPFDADSNRRERTVRWRLLRRLVKQKTALLGLVICLALGFSAVFAPYITPYDPMKINMRERLQTPSAAHWFGTDELGRDVLTRLIFGARISLTVGAISILVALSIGVPLGVISAFYGGFVDTWIMRTMDALAAFPAILLALAIVSVLGPNIRNAMIAIGIVYLPAFSRMARASVLSVQENDFVEAGRAAGATDARLMLRTILPNAFAPILVLASLGFANAIIIESGLSFLGLGAQAPSPSWGLMLNQGRQFMTQTVWYSVSAGLAIFISVLGLNLVGDGLRDVLDPRLRGR
ncbi:MAG: ABC transporter permease [Truepera sp.]|nr:ABC transporter permease [Truepera sp.]